MVAMFRMIERVRVAIARGIRAEQPAVDIILDVFTPDGEYAVLFLAGTTGYVIFSANDNY